MMGTPQVAYEAVTGGAKLLLDGLIREFAKKIGEEMGMPLPRAEAAVKELLAAGHMKFLYDDGLGEFSIMLTATGERVGAKLCRP